MFNVHGGDVFRLSRKLGCEPFDVLDFSSNISPIATPGLSELLCDAIEEIRYLPDTENLGLRTAMSRRYGLPHECFWPGGGTTEFIFAIPWTFRKEQAVIVSPTYADYETAAKRAGLSVCFVNGFLVDAEENPSQLISSILKVLTRPSLIFLCNPNNPTGCFLPRELLLSAICAASREHLWVVDESYVQFVQNDSEASLLFARPFPANLLVLRSFSKIYAVPGLRLGYLVGESALIDRVVKETAIPWNINRLAQVAGEYLLGQIGHEAHVRAFCQREKTFLLQEIRRMPWLRYLPGHTHFFMLQLEKGIRAADLVFFLENNGVLVRNCHNFYGLNNSECIRISPRKRHDNERLVGLLNKMTMAIGV
ncbi:MAG: aminotransferase class I/II-fold pyridoxal phosphate-dependent enzyme [Dissulfuribacterales bacterium]